MSTLQGKLRQKSKGGQFYYRLTIAQGNRREFSLGTSDMDEACKKAAELDSIWLAPTSEVALAQMNAIRGFSMQAQKISFEEAWDKYQVHPNRATPHTVEERIGYRKSYEEFTRFATGIIGKKNQIGRQSPVSTRLRLVSAKSSPLTSNQRVLLSIHTTGK